MEKVYMTQDGYEKKLEEFKQLTVKLRDVSKRKITSAYDGSGDTWHDNFSYEQLDLIEDGMIVRLEKMQELLSNVVIIDKEELDESVVNIGDRILIEIIYEDGEREKLNVLLDDTSDEDYAVSLDSPLGRGLYKAELGKEYFYTVGEINNKFIVKKITKKQ